MDKVPYYGARERERERARARVKSKKIIKKREERVEMKNPQKREKSEKKIKKEGIKRLHAEIQCDLVGVG